jgi:hypothetical protein
MNVFFSARSLTRWFDVGSEAEERGLQTYTLNGKARLEIREGYDGPSFDDESGPSYPAKRHAVQARIATSIWFVPELLWTANVESRLSMRVGSDSATREELHDHESMLNSAAYGWYLPVESDLVKGYGAPNHDVLECKLKVPEDQSAELKTWLDRAAAAAHLLPSITLSGLYFQSEHRQRLTRVPLWEEFLKTKRPGTFESYHIRFRGTRNTNLGSVSRRRLD